MTSDEVSYYRERAKEERDRAAVSTDEFAAEVHEKLATLYEDLVSHSGQRRPTLSIVCRGH